MLTSFRLVLKLTQMKLLVLIVCFLTTFALTIQPIFAQKLASPSPQPSLSSMPIQEVNSFELFWPLVAGKTVDDGFVYSIKLLKEKVRGWLIFSKVSKANYEVFLATKRVLEAEKLIKEGKSDLANKTLDVVIKNLQEAEKRLEVALRNEEALGTDASSMISRLENIDKLALWLATQEEKSKGALQAVAGESQILVKKLRGN